MSPWNHRPQGWKSGWRQTKNTLGLSSRRFSVQAVCPWHKGMNEFLSHRSIPEIVAPEMIDRCWRTDFDLQLSCTETSIHKKHLTVNPFQRSSEALKRCREDALPTAPPFRLYTPAGSKRKHGQAMLQ